MPEKIEIAAAKALVNWKALFGKQVKAKAIEIATEEGTEIVTRSHYQTAASHAMLQLSESLKLEQITYERNEAA